jgi:uncharacterized SAM-binding protein YcdF (DUF218 family)
VTWILRAIKSIGGPGSFGFFLFSAVIGLALMIPKRTRRLGRLLVVLLTVCYLTLSIPAVSHSLAAQAGSPDYEAASITGGLDDLFVLEGDNNTARAVVASKVAAATKPRKLWVLGGKFLRDELIATGYPASLVPDVDGRPGNSPAWNASARTTREQMLLVGRLMQETGGKRAAVIVSRLQAMRTRGLAQRLGLDVLVIPAPVDHEPPISGTPRWMPSFAGLLLSRDALYEMLALAYYRRNGWI